MFGMSAKDRMAMFQQKAAGTETKKTKAPPKKIVKIGAKTDPNTTTTATTKKTTKKVVKKTTNEAEGGDTKVETTVTKTETVSDKDGTKTTTSEAKSSGVVPKSEDKKEVVAKKEEPSSKVTAKDETVSKTTEKAGTSTKVTEKKETSAKATEKAGTSSKVTEKVETSKKVTEKVEPSKEIQIVETKAESGSVTVENFDLDSEFEANADIVSDVESFAPSSTTEGNMTFSITSEVSTSEEVDGSATPVQAIEDASGSMESGGFTLSFTTDVSTEENVMDAAVSQDSDAVIIVSSDTTTEVSPAQIKSDEIKAVVTAETTSVTSTAPELKPVELAVKEEKASEKVTSKQEAKVEKKEQKAETSVTKKDEKKVIKEEKKETAKVDPAKDAKQEVPPKTETVQKTKTEPVATPPKKDVPAAPQTKAEDQSSTKSQKEEVKATAAVTTTETAKVAEKVEKKADVQSTAAVVAQTAQPATTDTKAKLEVQQPVKKRSKSIVETVFPKPEYKALSDDFFNTIFYFSGMGCVTGSALSKGIYVPPTPAKLALDIDLVENLENKKDAATVRRETVVQTARHQAVDLAEELRRLQELLGGLPSFKDDNLHPIDQRHMDKPIQARLQTYNQGQRQQQQQYHGRITMQTQHRFPGSEPGSAFARPAAPTRPMQPLQPVQARVPAPPPQPLKRPPVPGAVAVMPALPTQPLKRPPAPGAVAVMPGIEAVIPNIVPRVANKPPPTKPKSPSPEPCRVEVSITDANDGGNVVSEELVQPNERILPQAGPPASYLSNQPPTGSQLSPRYSDKPREIGCFDPNKITPNPQPGSQRSPRYSETPHEIGCFDPSKINPPPHPAPQLAPQNVSNLPKTPQMSHSTAHTDWQGTYGAIAASDNQTARPFSHKGQVDFKNLKPWQVSRLRGMEARGYQFVTSEIPQSGADYTGDAFVGKNTLEDEITSYAPFLVSNKSKQRDEFDLLAKSGHTPVQASSFQPIANGSALAGVILPYSDM